MAITEQQRIDRRNHIGSSDIAALFTDKDGKSLDPFKTAADVWVTKVYDLKDAKTTEAQSRGNRYEEALIRYVYDQTGSHIVTEPEKLHFVCEHYPFFAANLDGYIESDNIIVEAKTTNMGDEYGDPGTDQVPFRVNLQVHHQMLCTGWNTAYVATLRAMFGRLDESMYIIQRDERIIDAIVKKGTWFWYECVLKKTPPPDSVAGDIELYKRIIRTPAKYAEVDPALIKKWERTKAAQNRLKNRVEQLQAEVLLQLGDAEGAHIDTEHELTYFEQKAKDIINIDLLKSKYPKIYEKISKPNTCRVARIRRIGK